MSSNKQMNSLNTQQIVFVCGALRSGSTLFHLMLDSHPDIKNPGEFDFFFDKTIGDDNFPEINDYHEYLTLNRIFQSKNIEIDKNLPYIDLIFYFVRQLSGGGNVLALNIHRNFERAYKLFPQAKFIHLLRDPRDVAKSSIGMNWSGNVFYGVHHWLETEKSWDNLALQLGNDQYCEITFEELIAKPEYTLEQVTAFLNLPYTSKMLDYQKKSTYKKPDINLIYQWKSKQSNQEIQFVESLVHHYLENKGYELSGLPLITISKYRKVSLAIQNIFYKNYMSIRRYGLYIYIIRKLSKYLGIKRMQNYAKFKVNEIDRSLVR